MDCIVRGVTKIQIQLSDFHFHFSLFLVAQTVKSLPTMQETQVQSLGWEDPLEKDMATQYSYLENSMDCIVRGVTKSLTQPNDFHFHILALPLLQYNKSPYDSPSPSESSHVCTYFLPRLNNSVFFNCCF